MSVITYDSFLDWRPARRGLRGACRGYGDSSILAYWELLTGDDGLLKSLTMSGVGPAPEMSIEFAPRVNALTGDNGLGKSFLLDMAWCALTSTWARGIIASPRRNAAAASLGYRQFGVEADSIREFSRERYQWTPSTSLRPWSIVIYAGVDGNFLVRDPARVQSNLVLSTLTAEPEMAKVFDLTAEQVWKGKTGERGVSYCNGLIQDWVSWQKSGDPAFGELERVLSALSPSSAEKLSPGQPVHLDLVDETEYPTIRTSDGEDVPLVHASAGIRRIAALAYVLVWTWKGHMRASTQRGQTATVNIVFLVDEVESHLHPQWQRGVVPALLNVMSAMKLDSEVAVQLILATHSPLVLASMESFFDTEKDALFHLDLRDGVAVLEKLEWAKQGDATNWLVSESFGLKQARSLEAETAIEAAEEFMRSEGSRTRTEIDEELRRVLAGHDDFWPRWVVATHPELAGPKAQRRCCGLIAEG